MPEIFLSYRRADAAAAAGRLYDALVRNFGPAQVFRDLDSIEGGEDFEHRIRGALADAVAVLVVIGPDWLQARGTDGLRRIDQADDYVRREIEIALASDAQVIPVLVDEATFPEAERLPSSIRALARRHAVELTNRHWHQDVEQLLRRLEKAGVPAAMQAGHGLRPQGARRLLLAGVNSFFPALVNLLRRPRVFLRAKVRGRDTDLSEAFLFYLFATLIAFGILVGVYTPQKPVDMAFAMVIMALLLVALASLPVWLGWRLVGARHHYARVLTLLLYQTAVVQLLLLIAMTFIVLAVELRSRQFLSELMGELLRPGESLDGAIRIMQERVLPLTGSSELQIASVLASLTLVGALVWTLFAWGSYRDVLDMERWRAMVATAIAVAVAGGCMAALMQLT